MPEPAHTALVPLMISYPGSRPVGASVATRKNANKRLKSEARIRVGCVLVCHIGAPALAFSLYGLNVLPGIPGRYLKPRHGLRGMCFDRIPVNPG